MKKILYIFLTLSILSLGCSKEDDTQIIQQSTLILDENLYGKWYLDNPWERNYRTFSSSGKWAYWKEDLINGVPNDIPWNENTGEWWVQSGYVFLQYQSSSVTDIFLYSVSGNTLTLNLGSWTKE